MPDNINIDASFLSAARIVKVDPAPVLDSRVSDLEEATSALETYKSARVLTSDFCIQTDGGCVPATVDPDFDNAPLINAALNRVGRDIRGTIVVPCYDYVIKQSIVIPARVGSRIQGAGAGGIHYGSYLSEASLMGAIPRFCWRGAVGGVMVENRAQGCHWSGVALYGSYGADGTTYKPSVGMYIKENAGYGMATGHHQFDSFTVRGCGVGVDFGVSGGANAEVSHFNNYRAVYCDTGFRTSSGQTLGLTIVNYEPFGTPTAFDFQAGGRFVVVGLDIVTPGTAIKFGDIGSGNCTFEFHGVGIDGAIGAGTLTLFDFVYNWKPANILVTGLHRSSAHTGTFRANIKGGAVVTIQNGYGIPVDFVTFTGSASGIPHLMLRDCTFSVVSSPNEIVNAASSGTYKIGWSGAIHGYAGGVYAGAEFNDKEYND